MSLANAKIALVFDWMTTHGGAEEVNLRLHKMFPDAPIFTSVYNPEKVRGFQKARIKTSFIQHLPFAKTKHQLYIGMMPYAYEMFDLSEYDIVISSSHATAKGIITKPETMHICYCHSPMRYAWDDWHSYINNYKMNPILKHIGKKKIHKLRIWDRISAERVDHYIANSSTTQKRIKKYYNKDSEIIHPMITRKDYKQSKDPQGYFLAVGRLTPYKKFDLIVEAFNKTGLPLKIVGTGIHEEDLRRMANDNIEFLGYVTDEELKKMYSECEALIFPQLEDFGITPLEAMASGRPVIAYKAGGALDTVVEGKTGVFFDHQTPKSLIDGINKYQAEKKNFKTAELLKHTAKFDDAEFAKKLDIFIRQKWSEWQK